MIELSNLLPNEQKILKELVKSKKDINAGIQNYQSGRLLEYAGFNFAAIKWDKEGNKPIQIYYEDKKTEESFYKNLFILYDYLLFLEELEKERLIVILPAKLEGEQEKERILFNRRIYKNKEVFNSWQLNDSINGFIFLDSSRKEYKSWIDITSYLEKYVYLKIIYPTSALESYVNNGFKTQEQLRHEQVINNQIEIHKEEMDNLREQLKQTKCSTRVAFITLFATIVFGVWRQCSSSRIESHDLESIAKSFQYFNSSQLPVNTAIVSDTIMAIDTLYTDSCNKTVSASPITSEQSEAVSVGLQKDTSIITTKSVTKDTVVIQTIKQ